MTNQEAIKMLTAKVECIRRETSGTDIDCNLRNCDDCELCYTQGTTGEQRKALNMAISALQAQEAKQEVKKSRCTYKPDCPWYDGSKCNSPNDHGYHECDYDRGIFPESYEEEIKNSNESSLTQKGLDTISRQADIEINRTYHGQMPNEVNHRIWKEINELSSAQPEIIHCRDCRYSTDFYQDGCCYCKRPSKEMRYIEEGYGFYCAGAERRTDEGGSDR